MSPISSSACRLGRVGQGETSASAFPCEIVTRDKGRRGKKRALSSSASNATTNTMPAMTTSLYPSLLNISLEIMLLLTSTNWVTWKAVLFSVLAPYEGALEMLTGQYKGKSSKYSLQTDKELLSTHPPSCVARAATSSASSHLRAPSLEQPSLC